MVVSDPHAVSIMPSLYDLPCTAKHCWSIFRLPATTRGLAGCMMVLVMGKIIAKTVKNLRKVAVTVCVSLGHHHIVRWCSECSRKRRGGTAVTPTHHHAQLNVATLQKAVQSPSTDRAGVAGI